MKSKQTLEVYDRMGNELIYDTEPRLCEEIVTIISQRNKINNHYTWGPRKTSFQIAVQKSYIVGIIFS